MHSIDTPAGPAVRFAPGYFVTKSGKVFSLRGRHEMQRRAPHELRQCEGNGGYLFVGVYNPHQILVRVNRIVLAAWVGPPPSEKYHACHVDGNRQNNSLGNLRWGTPQENSDDINRHGRRARGTGCGQAKLTEQAVREILSSPLSARQLARNYGVSSVTVDSVRKRETWRHVEL